MAASTTLGATPNAPLTRLFAADSVWNAPVSATSPLDPTSADRMAALATEIRGEVTKGWGPWISETSSSTPIYTVGPDQRRVSVKLDTGSWGAPLQQAWNQGVPIPAGATAAAGSDHHMTIYQPSTDTLWEFWEATVQSDGWHARWGGVMQNVSTNPGYYTGSSWPGLSGDSGWNWGGTATSLPVAAGTIRINELARGVIDHALAIDLPNACVGTFSFPAQRTDGADTTPTCIPEGAHLRIDPSVDLDSLNLPPITLVLARAAQRYGMIVRDKTGHATGFYAEDPTPTGSDPYIGPTGFYGGLRPWKFLPQFPWDRLQLLKMTLCQSAPCVPAAATAASATRRVSAKRQSKTTRRRARR